MQMSDLNELMQPLFMGNTVKNETVMFLDAGDVKELLYPISDIISVTSYDGTDTYEAGADYAVVGGKLQVLPGSRIPLITSAVYYNDADSIITVGGKKIFWGENEIQPYQVNVTYTHEAAWTGYTQESQLALYGGVVKKLEAGENVTVIFYGDSITYGANASWIAGHAPRQYPYTILFTEALADLFGYTVHYEDYSHLHTNGLTGAPGVPAQDYVAGTRGTITYINTAEGGENATHAASAGKIVPFLLDPIRGHGCDLLVVAYGMNDNVANINRPIQTMLNQVWEVDSNVAVVLVSTMMPHPDSNFENGHAEQEGRLLTFAENQRGRDKTVAVACMNSISRAILDKKTFNDYSGNNVNHPNDFFTRVYAQSLLQTVIGYENIN